MRKTAFDSCMSGAAYIAQTKQSVKIVLEYSDNRITNDIREAIEKALNEYGFLSVCDWTENSKGETTNVYL